MIRFIHNHSAALCVLAMAAVYILGLTDGALAQGFPEAANEAANSGFLGQGTKRLQNLYAVLKTTFGVVAGLGIIVLAVLAVFGKFQWRTLFMIAAGVFLVAMSSELLEWLGLAVPKSMGG